MNLDVGVLLMTKKTKQQRYKQRKKDNGYDRADIHLPKEIMAWVDSEKGERSRSEFIAEKLGEVK